MVSAIGHPIKVDANTLIVERGNIGRVCVEKLVERGNQSRWHLEPSLC